MMISPVSFAGTTTQAKTFKDIINQPQVHRTEQPAATSSIKGNKKKGSIGKKVLIAGGVIAATCAALAVGFKTGISGKILLATEKIKNEKLKNVIGFIASLPMYAGEKIYNGGACLINKIAKKAPEVVNNAENIN